MMRINIEVSGSSPNPLEELYISSTLGSVTKDFDRGVSSVDVELSPLMGSRAGRFGCRIKINTVSGSISIAGEGHSTASAFTEAAHKVDRLLFSHFHRSEAASHPPTGLAA